MQEQTERTDERISGSKGMLHQRNVRIWEMMDVYEEGSEAYH